jgi:SAM-dependent methyltransferase
MIPDTDLTPREYVHCNLCGADSTRLWGRKQGINIVECRQCGLIYANPRLDSEQLRRYYSADYFSGGDYAADEQRGRMYEIEIRQMLKIIGSRGRFLDVGCAYGRFLSYLPDTFEKYGVEFSAEAVAYGQEKFGFDIRVGQLHEIPFEDSFFDIVQFRGVFEHLQDPQRDLEVCHRILKNSGWLVLSTVPNIDGPCGKLYRERFRLVFPREHLYYFSRETLTRYCERNGFRVHKVFYPYLGTPYENLWRDLFAFVANCLLGYESPPFFRSVITIYARKESL